MAAMTDFLRNNLGNYVLRNVGYAAPATVYLGLFTTLTDATGAGTEVSGSGYARQALSLSGFVSGTSSNPAEIFFPTAAAPWFVVGWLGVFDALTFGNMLFYGHFDIPRFVNTNQVYSVPINSLNIVLT